MSDGNFANDIQSILTYAADVSAKVCHGGCVGPDGAVRGRHPNHEHRATGPWVEVRELSEALNVPRPTVNYIFFFESQGVVSREVEVLREDDEGNVTREVEVRTRFSVFDRIAAKYGVRYRIRKVHLADGGKVREECDGDHDLDAWQIAATYKTAQDREDERWPSR